MIFFLLIQEENLGKFSKNFVVFVKFVQLEIRKRKKNINKLTVERLCSKENYFWLQISCWRFFLMNFWQKCWEIFLENERRQREPQEIFLNLRGMFWTEQPLAYFRQKRVKQQGLVILWTIKEKGLGFCFYRWLKQWVVLADFLGWIQ